MHGETGFVCGSSGRFTLALALELLLRDHARRGRMAIAARHAALARSWPRALVPLFDTWREAVMPISSSGSAVLAKPLEGSELAALQRVYTPSDAALR